MLKNLNISTQFLRKGTHVRKKNHLRNIWKTNFLNYYFDIAANY